ncbi:MAG: DeoR/GlpR family DNA-binding transcription regulator [Anaerolineales bacterium]|jgi:DeoR/GlpR family transcriptional regulator of sugar metabolism
MNDRLNAHKRRELIASQIRDRGSIQVAELMDEFGLTDTSIRRDLSILESKGIIRRVHGGAVSTSEGLQIALLNERKIKFEAEKRRIGAVAAEYIQPRDVVLMDTGTSVLQVARHIPESIRQLGTLRIVTNSTLLLDEMGSWATPNLLLLGGIFLPEHFATVGPEVLNSLQQISAHRAFLGCDGLTINGGITSAHPLVAQTGREMANRAEQVIVLADHSKLGRAGFMPIMPINKIDILITDSSAPEQMIESLRERDVQVLVVPVHD